MPASRAFTLRDLCFGLVALALAAALITAATAGARKRAQLASAQSQLRWIAGVTSSYAADFDDRMWGLSWQAGTLPHTTPGLPRLAAHGLSATAVQAIEILHRRGRPDMQIPPAWYAGSLYNHLPLLDYLDKDAPDLNFVSPGDVHRLNWTKDPQEQFDTGFWLPYQPEPDQFSKRWPYSASFVVPPHMASSPVSGTEAIHQSWLTHREYTVGDEITFKGVRLSAVALPSQKVMLHESATWHFGNTTRYFADHRARVLALAVDGAAQALATADTNRGWHPLVATSEAFMRFRYEPAVWEGPPPAAGEETMLGHYRFTRGGPAGRDFGGPEIDTGQP